MQTNHCQVLQQQAKHSIRLFDALMIRLGRAAEMGGGNSRTFEIEQAEIRFFPLEMEGRVMGQIQVDITDPLGIDQHTGLETARREKEAQPVVGIEGRAALMTITQQGEQRYRRQRNRN